MLAGVDGAAVSWAVAETESVETQHTSHTVTQQTHLHKHTQTNSARISSAFLHAINTVGQISGLHKYSSIYSKAWQSITRLINHTETTEL